MANIIPTMMNWVVRFTEGTGPEPGGGHTPFTLASSLQQFPVQVPAAPQASHSPKVLYGWGVEGSYIGIHLPLCVQV